MPTSLLRRVSSTLSDRPPSYTTYDPSDSPPGLPPPFTDFPPRYRVGKHEALLVQVGTVKCHLMLLAAFHKLRQDVEGISGGWTGHLEPKARWALFVQCAVRRFDLLFDQCCGRDPSMWLLPPLDVALVMHSFMLNPGRYEEDRLRLDGGWQLREMKRVLMTKVVKALRQGLYASPKGSTADTWLAQTQTMWDPLAEFALPSKFTFDDPRTKQPITVNWLELDGSGYAQQQFRYFAPDGQKWTHESLGIARLCRDIRSSTTLAGTVVSTHELPVYTTSSKRAMFVRTRLQAQMPVQIAHSAHDLGRMLGWQRKGAAVLLTAALGKKNTHAYVLCLMEEEKVLTLQAGRVNNILAHYTRGERFSLDLASAVLRQGTFIDKMHDLGWLEPGRFDEDDTILQRCVARYHAFLDLLSSTPSMFCVPTLDIDLAWHTHQLTERYATDMVFYTGRFIDHDDKVEENALATAFDVTARAWQSRFGVPYSTCGCPLPSAPPLSRLLNRGSGSSTPYASGALLPHSASLEDADATHASEHNALVLPLHPDAVRRRQQRKVEYEARRRRQAREEEKEARKMVKRGGKGKALEAEDADVVRRRRDGHDAAFFAAYPVVPIYGPVGYPIPVAGCCSYEANSSGAGTKDGYSAVCVFLFPWLRAQESSN
ncbi:hypothetical protein JCM10207_000420 [Rhodosporidiobolus poonsookiae]